MCIPTVLLLIYFHPNLKNCFPAKQNIDFFWVILILFDTFVYIMYYDKAKNTILDTCVAVYSSGNFSFEIDEGMKNLYRWSIIFNYYLFLLLISYII